MARILLADDDPGALDFVRRALETAGHQVVAADDGASALSVLMAEGAFDLLLTDVQMPGLDGIALTAEAMKAHPSLRVILMSGYPDVLIKARPRVPASVRLLTKPFSLETVRREVAAALGA